MVDPFRSALAQNKLAYNDPKSARDYEKQRFTGLLGRARDRREQLASACALQQFMQQSTVLDCPSGNGRWFSRLALRARHIIAVDVAPAMLDVAATRTVPGVTIEIKEGDAEHLPLEDESVDHVFCFALMKHLPRQNQLNVLREFRRVSAGRMAVSFCIANPLSAMVWRLRGGKGYPLSPSELTSLLAEAGLRLGAIYPVSIPLVGLEAIVMLERV